MIEITHKKGYIKINGHAGFAPHGQDIVCAAVSTLVQNMVVSVLELTTDEIIIGRNNGQIQTIEYGNLSAKAQLLVDSFFIGIQMVADSYPKNVKLTKL